MELNISQIGDVAYDMAKKAWAALTRLPKWSLIIAAAFLVVMLASLSAKRFERDVMVPLIGAPVDATDPNARVLAELAEIKALLTAKPAAQASKVKVRGGSGSK